MSPIFILADDLSGAAELAGIAFQHGLTAEVQTRFDSSSTAGAIALDTDSRVLPAADAAVCIQAAVEQARALQACWLYKKVDSLLRGNVRAEIEAALQTAGLTRAILVPANPSRGRVIRGGRYFVSGQPLDQTPLAHDPHHPRRSADVRSLLGEGQQPVHILSRDAPLPASGILVPDVESPADLAYLAASVDAKTLAAGAADFFESLLIHRGHSQSQSSHPIQLIAPALLVCGSRVAWPDRRSDCERANIPVLVADSGGTEPGYFGSMLLGIADEHVDPAAALWALSNLTAGLIPMLHVNTVLIEGGATASAVAQRLHWRRFAVAMQAPAGVGALRPVGPDAPLVLIKPGSYPWPTQIWDDFCRLNVG